MEVKTVPDYLEFRKSISKELIAVKDRIRNFISDHHWGEDGRFKEYILMQTLRNYLPDSVRVGTGFVISGEQCSGQIDVIVYSASVTPFFHSGDFVIVEKNGVRGIIEVKTRLNKAQVADVVKKAHENGALIDFPIFNGIFAYETDLCAYDVALPPKAKKALKKYKGNVNNIAVGPDIFMKYWSENSLLQNKREHISFYNIIELSFGYFISNLAEDVSGSQLSEERQRYYYPAEGGKEQQRIANFEITLTN
jgi:signal peptidase I